MPHLPISEHANLLIRHDGTNHTASDPVLHVICAWPVSGQYGPGSRVLYYVLVLVCVLARKQDWIKGPCLAATLLIPAVAALHGIVLAAVQIPDAVDMDLYGVFQVCSIGVLTALVTFNQSKTYSNGPGRNIIFLWSGLVLAGLLSLTVAFYRTHSKVCPEYYPLDSFPYGNYMCGLTCNVTAGPFSPIRTGLGTNMAVIPAPTKLTYNTAMLLSAACCIPAILSIILVWMKLLESKDKTLFGEHTEFGEKKLLNQNLLKVFRHSFEIPLFAGAVIAILILGERNLFSKQVRFMTEPLDNVGQWTPIVGTGLAVMGSLYLLWEDAIDDAEEILRVDAERGRRPSQTGSISTVLTNEKQEILLRLAITYVKWRNAHMPAEDTTAELFREETQTNYPTVPGESGRNEDLSRISEQYHEDTIRQRSMERSTSQDNSSVASPRPERRDTLDVWKPTTPTSAGPRRDPADQRHHVSAHSKRRATMDMAGAIPSSSRSNADGPQSRSSLGGSPRFKLTRFTTAAFTSEPEGSTNPQSDALTRIPSIVISPEPDTGPPRSRVGRGIRSTSEPMRPRGSNANK